MNNFTAVHILTSIKSQIYKNLKTFSAHWEKTEVADSYDIVCIKHKMHGKKDKISCTKLELLSS